jgi:hypothetical protein
MYLASLLPTGDGAPQVTTAFEDWCEARSIHPESFGAWECYVRSGALLRPAVPAGVA